MAVLQVERLGGLAGFGGIHSRLRSRGEIDLSKLSQEQRRAVEACFQAARGASPGNVADGFRYRLTRTSGTESETVEIPEDQVPSMVAACVRDEFA